MIFLVDHNLEGHALLLSGNIASLGWLDLLPIRFVTFEEIELAVTSDRIHALQNPHRPESHIFQVADWRSNDV